MILRSGKVIPPPKCYKCKQFYGNPIWNWRCSMCTNNSENIQVANFHTPEFQQRLNAWVIRRLANPQTCRVLKWATKYHFWLGGGIGLMKAVLNKLRQNREYITAKFADELLRRCGRDIVEKSHLILPFVIDWWNMRKYNFKSFELCYYGRFGDDPALHIKSIPPPSIGTYLGNLQL